MTTVIASARPSVFRELFPPQDRAKAQRETQRFLEEHDVGVDGMYASFSAIEGEYMSSGGGSFAEPLSRAFGYRTIIDHLLRTGFGHRLENGTLVPMGRLVFARELFQRGCERGVWDPQAASAIDQGRCMNQKSAAEDAIQQAELAIEREGAIDEREGEEEVSDEEFFGRYETPTDEDEENEYSLSTDPIDRLAHEFMRVKDFSIVKRK